MITFDVAVLFLAARFALGAVFALSAAQKIAAPNAFAEAVRAYDLLPRSLVKVFAYGVLTAEATASLSLLTGWALKPGMSVAIALLIVFAVAVSLNLVRNRRVPCGCLGEGSETLSARTLVRLGLLLGLAAFAALDVTQDVASDSERVGAAIPFAAALAVGGLWLLHIPDLVVLAKRAMQLRAVARSEVAQTSIRRN